MVHWTRLSLALVLVLLGIDTACMASPLFASSPGPLIPQSRPTMESSIPDEPVKIQKQPVLNGISPPVQREDERGMDEGENDEFDQQSSLGWSNDSTTHQHPSQPMFTSKYSAPGFPLPQPVLHPSGGISKATLRHLQLAAKLSSISYCGIASLRSFNCTLCREDPDLLNHITHVQTFHSVQAHVQGFTALDHARQTIIIAFRGSSTHLDTMTNLHFTPVLAPDSEGLPAAIGIHRGFFAIYSEIHASMERQLAALYSAHPNYTLLFTGHSMGAAYASIAVVFALNYLQLPPSAIELITFGQPRTGNDVFVRYLQSAGLRASYRVTNALDPVVHLPPRWLTSLRHFGQEVFTDDSHHVRLCHELRDDEASDCANAREYTTRLRNLFRAASYLPHHKNYLGVGQGRLSRC